MAGGIRTLGPLLGIRVIYHYTFYVGTLLVRVLLAMWPFLSQATCLSPLNKMVNSLLTMPYINLRIYISHGGVHWPYQ